MKKNFYTILASAVGVASVLLTYAFYPDIKQIAIESFSLKHHYRHVNEILLNDILKIIIGI